MILQVLQTCLLKWVLNASIEYNEDSICVGGGSLTGLNGNDLFSGQSFFFYPFDHLFADLWERASLLFVLREDC